MESVNQLFLRSRRNAGVKAKGVFLEWNERAAQNDASWIHPQYFRVRLSLFWIIFSGIRTAASSLQDERDFNGFQSYNPDKKYNAICMAAVSSYTSTGSFISLICFASSSQYFIFVVWPGGAHSSHHQKNHLGSPSWKYTGNFNPFLEHHPKIISFPSLCIR